MTRKESIREKVVVAVAPILEKIVESRFKWFRSYGEGLRSTRVDLTEDCPIVRALEVEGNQRKL